MGGLYNCALGWGHSVVTSYPGNPALYAYYLDSTDGNAENTLVMDHISSSNALGLSVTSSAIYATGTALNDVDVDFLNSAGDAYGVQIYFAGGSANAGASSDMHFHNLTIDGFGIEAVKVTGLQAATLGSADFNTGWFTSISNGTQSALDIESSSGVTVENVQMNNSAGNGVLVENSSNIKVNGNLLQRMTGNMVQVDNSSGVSVTDNVLYATQGFTAHSLLAVTGTSSHVALLGNTLGGYAQYGYLIASGLTDVQAAGNPMDTTNIATPVSDTGGSLSFSVPGKLTFGSCPGCGGGGGGSGAANITALTPTSSSSYGEISSGSGINAPIFGLVAGSQSIFGANAYYDGSNWQRAVTGSAAAWREMNITSHDYPSYNVGGAFHDCPPDSAGPMSTWDTTCQGLALFPGLDSSGNLLHRMVLNPQGWGTGSVYTPGTDIGKGTIFEVNKPTAIDNSAVAVVSAKYATDKPLVVTGAASQTGNLQEWRNSGSTATIAGQVFIGPDGTLQEKDTANGHTYRISITNGAVALTQVN